MTPHWHDENPWRDDIIYVTLEEAAACCDGRTVEGYLSVWWRASNALDAYILPQPSEHHDIGVRWGSRGEQYFSPANNVERTQALLDKYRSGG